MSTIFEFKDGIFVITETDHCPLYLQGEEFHVNNGVLRLPPGKLTCLILAQDIVRISSRQDSLVARGPGKGDAPVFNCSGCSRGMIHFGYRKTKNFVTSQMKLLVDVQHRNNYMEGRAYYGLLRRVKVFADLNEQELQDMAGLLNYTEFETSEAIAEKGHQGMLLNILLSGNAEVVDDQGIALDEIKEGDVFGEMSLLSGDRISQTVLAVTPCKVGRLGKDDFKSLLNRYPALQNYFYKLLVTRINEANRRRGVELTSGMVGQLTDISPVELCQMVNSSQKTGRLHLDFENVKDGDRGVMLFNEGELVGAEFGDLTGNEAFYRMLSNETGRFRFLPGLTREESSREVVGSFMGLLMEGMKYLDDSM
jgi:CRP-like cAMP-binding protein